MITLFSPEVDDYTQIRFWPTVDMETGIFAGFIDEKAHLLDFGPDHATLEPHPYDADEAKLRPLSPDASRS